MRLAPSWPRRRRGVTLVEALAGAVLLGTLLVSILVARGRMSVQARKADDRLQSVRILEELMDTLWSTPPFPREGGGEVMERPGWLWRTRVVGLDDSLKAEIVAVELLDSKASPEAAPAARVDVLVPLPKPKEEDKTQDAPAEPPGGVRSGVRSGVPGGLPGRTAAPPSPGRGP